MIDRGAYMDVLRGRVPSRRRLVIFGLVVVVLVALSAAGISAFGAARASHERSPEYALETVGRAAERGDWDTVSGYVDAVSIAAAYADAAIASARDGDSSETGVAGDESPAHGRPDPSIGAPAAAGGSAMRDTFVRTYVEYLRAAVTGGTLAKGGDASKALLAREVVGVRRSGDTDAVVLVNVQDSQGLKKEVGVRMRRVGESWRVVALDNVNELLGPVR